VSGEVAAILLLAVVHIAGAALLIGLMFDGTDSAWRGWWPHDDRPEDPGPEPADPPAGTLPLPDAAPAALRLREPGRLADAHERHRRPEHAPEPARRREPV
jgi:hypothetical protein